MTDTATPAGTAIVPVADLFFPLSAGRSLAPPTAAAVVPVAATPPAMRAAEAAPTGGSLATLIFGDSQALKSRYGEAPAQPSDLAFAIPTGWGDTPQDRAERASLGKAMAQSGVSKSVGHELWDCITAAGQQPITTTESECMTALRQHWGSRTDTMVARAKGAIMELSKTFPRAREYLVTTGLGNDPAFIKKVVAAVNRKR